MREIEEFEALASAKVLRNESTESVCGKVKVRKCSELREVWENLAGDGATREND